MNIDYSTIVTNFLSSYWYFIPIFVLIALFKSPWFKGVLGEFQVNLAAKLFLNKKDYHLIQNVTLPTEDGTTQIDHIIVSKYGVFVIESKNMKGWIFGSEKQPTWTQKIYKLTQKFQNPAIPDVPSSPGFMGYKGIGFRKLLENELGCKTSCLRSAWQPA